MNQVIDTETQKHLRSWIEVDNELRKRREKLKELTERKALLEDHLKAAVVGSELEHTKINIPDGSIRFAMKNNTQSITHKYLKEQLATYFKGLGDPAKANVDDLFQAIMDNRKVTSSFEVVRTVANNDDSKQK
jgi:hypothetical protein